LGRIPISIHISLLVLSNSLKSDILDWLSEMDKTKNDTSVIND